MSISTRGSSREHYSWKFLWVFEKVIVLVRWVCNTAGPVFVMVSDLIGPLHTHVCVLNQIN